MTLRNQTNDDATPGDARVPEGTRVYAVGDIHGMSEALAALRARIAADARRHGAARNVLVTIGDYVDRGPHAFDVVEQLIRDPLEEFETHHLKGNHEDFLLRFLETGEDGDLWLMNGGDATLRSYGIDVDAGMAFGADLRDLASRLRDAMPAEHLAFYRGLELLHREGDYVFAHAGVRPGVPMQRQDPADLMWIRDGFLDSDAELGAVVVHGHTITWEPEVRANRIGIDTGAFMTGRLTCLVLAGDRREWIVT